MNLTDLLRFASRAVDVGGLASTYKEDGKLALRALSNALGVCGFPVHRVFAAVARVGTKDPMALVLALRGDPAVRQWCHEWSGDNGPLPIPKPRKRRAH